MNTNHGCIYTQTFIKDFSSFALKQIWISKGTVQNQRTIAVFQSLTGSSLKTDEA